MDEYFTRTFSRNLAYVCSVNNWQPFRVANSRKGSCAPFWKGSFRCRVSNDCVKLTMSIVDEPANGSDVPVNVTIIGQCTHIAQDNDAKNIQGDLPNRRNLTGDNRRNAVTDLGSATEEYYARLSQMSEIEIQSANTTTCQSPAVLRQAAYENRLSKQLHYDMMLEVDVQREAWDVAMPGKFVNGYIQSISLVPFTVTCYTEGQLKLYIKECQKSDCTVHFDATGSVITNIENQKRTLYYCLLLGNGSMPICDFITTSHRSSNIRAQLDSFQDNVRLCNNGRTINPLYIVTDFSFAMIEACLRSFNAETLPKYLTYCQRLLTKKLTCHCEAQKSHMFVCGTLHKNYVE